INNKLFANNVNMKFNGSQDVKIANNQFYEEDVTKIIELNNSSRNSFNIDKKQDFHIIDNSAENMLRLVKQFRDDGDIPDHDAFRSLQLHLTSVDQFEKQGLGEKVIKHTESLKLLLNH